MSNTHKLRMLLFYFYFLHFFYIFERLGETMFSIDDIILLCEVTFIGKCSWFVVMNLNLDVLFLVIFWGGFFCHQFLGIACEALPAFSFILLFRHGSIFSGEDPQHVHERRRWHCVTVLRHWPAEARLFVVQEWWYFTREQQSRG